MKQYLFNLLPRIKQYSLTLNKLELLINEPWVLFDESHNKHKYIFKRDGQLVMSLNGKVIIGSWEYLAAADTILVDRINDKILLNKYYTDSKVMVLKKDGIGEDFFILANERLLPDLDVIAYFKKLYYSKHAISLLNLSSGTNLELHYYNGFMIGCQVSIDCEPVHEGEFFNGDEKIIINSGKIVAIKIRKKYNSTHGEVEIEQDVGKKLQEGDYVFKGANYASDGKYELIDSMFNIKVKDGRIIRKTLF